VLTYVQKTVLKQNVYLVFSGFYLSEDERLVRKVRSLGFFDELYAKHLKELQPGQIMPHSKYIFTRHREPKN
jgi:hypothetical protein